jgi:NAD(P)-dependent dehydrogenase (short-subunit alcohol dehydrogenase family)
MEAAAASASALRGRVAVVAGGTRGAGRGIAIALGRCGATVYVTGRSTAAGRSELGRSETIEETARLDVLVNDIWGGDALVQWGVPFWEHDLEAGLRAWRNAVETHLITSHRLAPLLVAGGSGLVIEVTDGDSDRYRGSLFYDLATTSAWTRRTGATASPRIRTSRSRRPPPTWAARPRRSRPTPP